MTALLAIRKAPGIDSYPALRLVASEAELIPVVRVEMCACGERIRQLAGDSVTAIVMAHVAGERHQAWREAAR